MAPSTTQPNHTLYINNLNDKINKEELKLQLLALFTTYGKLVDIIASKRDGMRGQAFLVFSDLADATTAMRACEGMMFYDKPLRIDYAKSKSYATSRREDPHFVPPTSIHSNPTLSQQMANGKRQRDGETDESRKPKREKADDSDEEMEIDDDDDDDDEAQDKTSSTTPTTVPQQVSSPTARLLCMNLPEEVTNDVLSVLFQQHPGLKSVNVTWSPTSNSAGARVKMAQVSYDSVDLATTAKDALDGFTLKKGWQMTVAYI